MTASEGTAAFGVSSAAGAAVAKLAPLAGAFMLLAGGKTHVRTNASEYHNITQTCDSIYIQGRLTIPSRVVRQSI